MKQIIDQIKTRGYWKFIIRPLDFRKNRIPDLNECHRLIRECKVLLRGWDFPHYPPDPGKCFNNVDYIESGIDQGRHLEYWRFYQSAQFVFLKGVWEDWDQREKGLFASHIKIESMQVIDIVSIVYTITEAFEFASRLANTNVLGADCHISVALSNCKGRRLTTFEHARDLSGEYKCQMNTILYEISAKAENLLGDSARMAREAIRFIFQRFNWCEVGVDQFKQEQEKLLSRSVG